jgi:hypothetical protein
MQPKARPASIVPILVLAPLEHMEPQGLTHIEHRRTTVGETFPRPVQTPVVSRCGYYGSEYSIREPLHECPSCGAYQR